MDDELLQDFLIEAGEILEGLNEQLVELENSPDDNELLNSIFRGFHTIKGGAGFLAIDPMVTVCHRAEDVFNLVRAGDREVNTELMDIILPVTDVLNEQFDALRSEEEPQAADPALIKGLEDIINGVSSGGGEATAADVPAETPPVAPSEAVVSDPNVGGDDITDDEFNLLLDSLEGKSTPDAVAAPEPEPEPSTASTSAPESDDITDDEFEALLDELHGSGKVDTANATSTPTPDSASQSKQEDTPAASGKPAVPDKSESENISDDEFESLLDELHGEGKIDTTAVGNNTDKPSTPAVPTPAKPAEKSAASTSKPAKQEPVAKKPVAAKENKQPVETSVRVDTSRLDDIMNMVGELVLVRNRISRLGSIMGGEEMAKAVSNLDLVTSDLQLAVMKTRMQPIKKVFGRFPRVVRDLARSLKKEIKVVSEGEDTDLDKNLVEALADPLVHLVRNSVDHGIEMPDDREAAGKPREGTVTLSASQEGDHILLAIEDDGKGIDPEVIKGIAINKGLLDADSAGRLSDTEVFNLIFEPGFSTKTEISDISGRGVGMDVVKTSITKLNGSVEIQSQLGKGSRLEIKVPLTLAIMSTLMVKLEEQMFALPLVNVNEIFHLDLEKTNVMDGQLVTIVRERTLPLFYLKHWLINNQRAAELPKEGHVVVVSIGTQKVCFLVDELLGQEEVVIKPLGALLHGLKGMAGATITGDGGIALILDVPGLMKNYV